MEPSVVARVGNGLGSVCRLGRVSGLPDKSPHNWIHHLTCLERVSDPCCDVATMLTLPYLCPGVNSFCFITKFGAGPETRALVYTRSSLHVFFTVTIFVNTVLLPVVPSLC
jgi:hypothetical protein